MLNNIAKLTVAISAQYIGVMVNSIPTAKPQNTRPAYIMPILRAVATSTNPMVIGIAEVSIPHLRPIVEAANPPTKGPASDNFVIVTSLHSSSILTEDVNDFID